MEVRKIGKSNFKENFRGKCKGIIPGISSSCFVLLFCSNAGVDVAYHAWVLSAAQDRRGCQRILINSFCPQTRGGKLLAHMQNTLYERMKKVGLFGQ